jgi:Rieske Fe-S protein
VSLPGCAVLRGGASHVVIDPSKTRLDGNLLQIPIQELATTSGDRVVEIKPGKSRPDLLVTQMSDGWRVVTAHCTHRGCVVDWNAAAMEWQCPCHGSRYAADGHVVHGPAQRALQSPPARVEGETLVVDLADLSQGPQGEGVRTGSGDK